MKYAVTILCLMLAGLALAQNRYSKTSTLINGALRMDARGATLPVYAYENNVVWHEFNYADGTNYYGYMPSAYNGYATNVGVNPTVSGNAAIFDGVNDFIMGNTTFTALNNKTGMTMCAWVKTKGTNYDSTVFTTISALASYGKSGGVTLRVIPLGKVRALFSDKDVATNYYYTTDNSVVVSGTWTHVAAWVGLDKTNMAIYVDGIEKVATKTSTMVTPHAFVASRPYRIGVSFNSGGPAFFMNGSVAHVSAYDQILSSNEIYQLSQQRKYE